MGESLYEPGFSPEEQVDKWASGEMPVFSEEEMKATLEEPDKRETVQNARERIMIANAENRADLLAALKKVTNLKDSEDKIYTPEELIKLVTAVLDGELPISELPTTYDLQNNVNEIREEELAKLGIHPKTNKAADQFPEDKKKLF